MNAIQSKAIITGIGFLLIILSGLWLSRAGKPYPVILFTLHKLITLGTIIYLGITLTRTNPAALPWQVALIALTAACFLAMLVTGGLLSVEKAMPDIVHRLHQILPYLTTASAGTALYLTLFARAIP